MNPAPATSRGAAPTLPAFANGKSGVATAKVTEDENVELNELEDASTSDKLPLHEDVMQLARLGEVGPIQKLFEEGKYSAKYRDEEGISPLHVRSTGNPHAILG